MIKQKLFWVEILIMMISPMPFNIFSSSQTVFEIPAINWVDNDGTYAAQSHKF